MSPRSPLWPRHARASAALVAVLAVVVPGCDRSGQPVAGSDGQTEVEWTGIRGGRIVETELGGVEIALRGRSFLVYLVGPRGELIPAEDTEGSLTIRRGSLDYTLRLHGVGGHLVANSWRPEEKPLEAELTLRRDGRSARATFAWDPPDEDVGKPWPKRGGGAHHDHGPRHGGVVVMDDRGEYHVELILARDGQHRFEVSDEFRNIIPPDHLGGGELIISRGDGSDETLPLVVEDGFLHARGKPIVGDASIRLVLQFEHRRDEPWSVELAFPSATATAAAEHASPQPPS